MWIGIFFIWLIIGAIVFTVIYHKTEKRGEKDEDKNGK